MHELCGVAGATPGPSRPAADPPGPYEAGPVARGFVVACAPATQSVVARRSRGTRRRPSKPGPKSLHPGTSGARVIVNWSDPADSFAVLVAPSRPRRTSARPHRCGSPRWARMPAASLIPGAVDPGTVDSGVKRPGAMGPARMFPGSGRSPSPGPANMRSRCPTRFSPHEPGGGSGPPTTCSPSHPSRGECPSPNCASSGRCPVVVLDGVPRDARWPGSPALRRRKPLRSFGRGTDGRRVGIDAVGAEQQRPGPPSAGPPLSASGHAGSLLGDTVYSGPPARVSSGSARRPSSPPRCC